LSPSVRSRIRYDGDAKIRLQLPRQISQQLFLQ
jgi:hypothetical protein